MRKTEGGTILFVPSPAYYDRDMRVLSEWKNKYGANIVSLNTRPGKFKNVKIFTKSLKLPTCLESIRSEPCPLYSRDIYLKQLKDIEQKIKRPAGLLLLKMERTVGRIYSRDFYEWPTSREQRFFIKNPEKCNLLIENKFIFFYRLLSENNISLIFGQVPGTIDTGILKLIAEYQCIPFVHSMVSPLISGRHYWTIDSTLYNRRTENLYKRYLLSSEPVEKKYDTQLEQFRKIPRVPQYINDAHREMSDRALFKDFYADCISGLYNILLSFREGEYLSGKPIFNLFYKSLKKRILTFVQKKYYHSFSEDQLKNIKYIYLPLTQMPEFVLNTQAPFWYDVINLVRLLSYHLPHGYLLLVKENRANVGRRARHFLSTINLMPGVKLVDPNTSPFPLMRYSDLVCTINGSTGWEALQLKKKVLTLDYSHYEPLDVLTKYTPGCNFGELILKALAFDPNQKSDFDYKIKLYMKSETEGTLSNSASSKQDLEYIITLIDDFYSLKDELCLEKLDSKGLDNAN